MLKLELKSLPNVVFLLFVSKNNNTCLHRLNFLLISKNKIVFNLAPALKEKTTMNGLTFVNNKRPKNFGEKGVGLVLNREMSLHIFLAVYVGTELRFSANSLTELRFSANFVAELLS